MTAEERRVADERITERLDRLVAERGGAWVLGYLALPDEVRLDGMLAGMAEQGVHVWLPRVQHGQLSLGRWRPAARLSRDEEGVLAPAQELLQGWPAGAGVILAPGRGFDRSGGRVGRGRGYYDRLLSRLSGSAVVVGVAYDCQIVEHVPREIHDRDVEIVVTESSTFVAPRDPVRPGGDTTDRGER